MIGALPAVYIFPALIVAWLWGKRTADSAWARYGIPFLVGGLFLLNLAITISYGFVRWPQALAVCFRFARWWDSPSSALLVGRCMHGNRRTIERIALTNRFETKGGREFAPITSAAKTIGPSH